jgi:hypothetical protein
MKLSKTERNLLMTFVTIAQNMLDSTAKSPRRGNGAKPRKRRSAADVALLKKQIRIARKRNRSVKAIADELGVTPAYIYQLGK